MSVFIFLEINHFDKSFLFWKTTILIVQFYFIDTYKHTSSLLANIQKIGFILLCDNFQIHNQRE